MPTYDTLSDLAALGHLSHGERQGMLAGRGKTPSPSSLCSATSPAGRGKECPLGELSPQVTERGLQLGLPSPSSLCSATSPAGRGKIPSPSSLCSATSPAGRGKRCPQGEARCPIRPQKRVRAAEQSAAVRAAGSARRMARKGRLLLAEKQSAVPRTAVPRPLFLPQRCR